ncbi:hypothetical protein F4679DRAFT_134941 [Xylaria curta]|nr:hypothetical protein F4679DRAFT_134941 [Xylaria curta]
MHRDDDLSILLSWAYYYDSMARFSIQHWPDLDGPQFPMPPSICRDVMISPSRDLDTIDLLAEVSSMISMKPPVSAPKEDIFDYRDHVSLLRGKIRMALKKRNRTLGNTPGTSIVVELFYIALSLYLDRGTEDLLDKHPKQLCEHIDRAFIIMSRLSSCERQFPLLILGIEARSDEQKIVFLDLLSRSRSVSSPNPVDQVKGIVEAIWAQQSLAEGHLDYMKLLKGVISPIVPLPIFI